MKIEIFIELSPRTYKEIRPEDWEKVLYVTTCAAKKEIYKAIQESL